MNRPTMSRHATHPQSYPYPATAPVQSTHRYSSNHSTSSAFSASANPNEDWTKISDLAERRRIQNRIAQRNYRKKLKKRLEDLERRAASTSASPEPMQEENEQDENNSRAQTSPVQRRAATTSPYTQQQQRFDERSLYPPNQFPHQASPSPPGLSSPALSYASSYSNSEAMSHPQPYSPQQHYTLGSSDVPLYGTYVPQSQSRGGERQVKTEYAVEQDWSAFNISYGPAVSTVDIPSRQSWHDSSSNPHVGNPNQRTYRR